MATYNWIYRPGLANKYGIAVAASDDDVKPSNASYVALWGNDDLGNGSRLKPFKTYSKVINSGFTGYVILGAGVYREEPINNVQQYQFIGDGDVVLDLTYRDVFCYTQSPAGIYNITFRGTGISYTMISNWTNGPLVDCVFDGVALGNSGGAYNCQITNCVFKNIFLPLKVDELLNTPNTATNCTFYNCTNMGVSPNGSTDYRSCLFVKCNIASSKDGFEKLRWSMFDRCNFKLDGRGNGGAVYPEVPAGYTYYDNIETLKADCLAAYNSPVLYGCNIGDAMLNNESIGDLSLNLLSLAKNVSYFGTYVGAQSIAYSVKVSSTEADGSFDFSTAVNLNISDDSLTMVNDGLLASIETKVITNLIQRELGKAPIYGFNADRNGQYIDSIADLANITISAGTDLIANTPYIVETAAIINDGHTIQPGERFTSNSAVSFTSAGGGVCREIIEAPQRHTIMAKFADVEADLATIPFQHYEPGIKFTSNNVGNSRIGAIVRGNGDPLYERGTGKEFPINARFMKFKYIIQPNNLKP